MLIADSLDAARAARTALDIAGDTRTTIVTVGGDVMTAQTLRTGAGGERSRLELAAERDAAKERLAEIRIVVDSLREAREEANDLVETTRRHAKDALRACASTTRPWRRTRNRSTVSPSDMSRRSPNASALRPDSPRRRLRSRMPRRRPRLRRPNWTVLWRRHGRCWTPRHGTACSRRWRPRGKPR